METWALCAMCERWFYCPADDRDEPPACPVCAAIPVVLEERVATTVGGS